MSTAPEQITITEVISEVPAASLAAVLDIDLPSTQDLPPLWHWLYLLPRPTQSQIGPDGHPLTGLPTPPAPGQRRMFAGGRVRHLAPLQIGQEATRTTAVIDSVEKVGRSGPLNFVTVRTQITQGGALKVSEEQDIVYRQERTDAEAATPPVPTPTTEPRTEPHLDLDVDETLLFRFSALTFNAHRIHYDLNWAAHEGYEGLVIHGPLQALMMGELHRRNGVDLRGREFGYRLLSPMVKPQTMRVEAGPDGVDAGSRVLSAAAVITARSTLTRPTND